MGSLRGATAWLLPLAITLFRPCHGAFYPGSVYDERRRFWNGTTSDRFTDDPVVKVGVPLSLRPGSTYFKFSTAYRTAYAMWFEWYAETYGGILINGTRHQVELFFMDDRSELDRVTWVTEYMANVEGIDLFLADYSSTLSIPMAETIHRLGKVMLAPNSAATSIFANRWGCFSNQPPADVYLKPAFEALVPVDNAVTKTVFTMYEAGLMSTICGGVTHFAPDFPSMRLVNADPYLSIATESDLDPVVDGWAATSPPDVVVACFYAEFCYSFLKKLWERGVSLKSVVLAGCTTGDAYVTTVQDAGQYILGTALWTAQMPLAGPLTKSWTSQGFYDEFVTRYREAPPYQAASAFVAAATLTYAIESANSTDPVKVAAAMQNINAESIVGTIAFDANGQTTNSMKIVQHQQTPYGLTVHPQGPNSHSLVYPIPSRALRACLNTDAAVDTGHGYLNGACIACPLGRVSVVANGTSATRVCEMCPAGFRGSVIFGLPYCQACSEGYYSSTPGAVVCSPCQPGDFGPATQATACQPCAVGKHTKVPGATECVACEGGTYQNSTRASSCLRCPTGTYMTTSAATACEDCLPSFTTSGSGYDTPSACGCPSGYFDQHLWDDSLPSLCTPCPKGIRCAGFEAPLELEPGYSADAAEFNPLGGVWLCVTKSLCPGGAPGTCSGGHLDVGCSLCPPGQVATDGVCRDCSSGSRSIFYAVVFICVMLMVPYYYMSNSDVSPDTKVRLGGSITIGLTVTTIQILGMISRLNVPWPAHLVPTVKAASFFLLEEDILVMPCSISRLPARSYFAIFLMPFVCIVLFTGITFSTYALPFLTRGRWAKWNIYKAFNTLLSFGQIGFITLTSISVIPLQCYSHPPPKNEQSMLKYPSVLCSYTGDHRLMVALGILIIVLLVLPFIVLCYWGSWQSYKGGQEQGMESNKIKMYRFLIFRFRPMVWWWGNVFNLRQLLLGFTPMITPDDPGMQVLYMVMVLIPYLMVLQLKLPWRTPELNMVDGLTTALLAILVVGVTSFLDATQFATVHSRIITVVLVMLCSVLGGLILYFIWTFLRRGPDGHFGVQYPPETKMQDFADTFRVLCKKVAALSKERNRDMLASMSSIECMEIDKVIAILVAHGVPMTKEEQRNCRTHTLALTTRSQRSERSEAIVRNYRVSEPGTELPSAPSPRQDASSPSGAPAPVDKGAVRTKKTPGVKMVCV